jgi:hypothetical protein
VKVVVGAKDDDGILGKDTFNILFNRPPISCNLKVGYNADKEGWSDFNYSSGKGNIQVSFTGIDADSLHDKLKYKLYWGTDSNNLALIVSGSDSIYEVKNIDTTTSYYWKLVAVDLFGDSVSRNGQYSSHQSPKGTVLNLPLTRPNYSALNQGLRPLMDFMSGEQKRFIRGIAFHINKRKVLGFKYSTATLKKFRSQKYLSGIS